jgi:ABC-2 type transport system permease protein
MLRNVTLKSLRDIGRGFLWWSLGLAGFVALIVSVWPTVHSNPSLNKLAQDYPEALQAFLAFGGAVDYSSAAGYLGIELFSLMVPLLLLVAAIGTGAGSIAVEEERGTLELLLANPVSRTKVVLEKTLAPWPSSSGSESCCGSRSGSAPCLRAWTSRPGTSLLRR